MTYLIVTLSILLVALLLLRLRLRIEFGSDRKIVAVNIGRSGPSWDFEHNRGEFRLFGWRVKGFDLKDKAKPGVTKKEPKDPKEKAKPERTRKISDMIAIFPQVSKALWFYAIGIIRSATIEQFEAEIEAGLPEPHLTGQLFGYYQAAFASVPSVMERFRYTPDWSGPSFSGSAKIAVALPVYKLAFRSMILIKDLPLRKILRLAIGEKKGASDG